MNILIVQMWQTTYSEGACSFVRRCVTSMAESRVSLSELLSTSNDDFPFDAHKANALRQLSELGLRLPIIRSTARKRVSLDIEASW